MSGVPRAEATSSDRERSPASSKSPPSSIERESSGVDEQVFGCEDADADQGLLATILESMFEAFALVEPVRSGLHEITDFIYVRVNDAACVSIGRTREELLGSALGSQLGGHGSEEVVALLRGCVESKTPLALEGVRLVDRDARTIRHIDLHAAPVDDMISLTWRDTTERERFRSRYRLLAENASDVISVADNHGTFEWISASVTELLGWRPDELLGKPIIDLVHPDDVPAVQAAQILFEEGVRREFIIRVRASDGAFVWVSVQVRPTLDAASGEIHRVASWSDASATVKEREARAHSEHRFQLLAENATDVVYETTAGTTITWISPSVTSVLGWRPDDVIGTVGFALVADEDRERASAARDEALAGLEPLPLEIRYRTADGGTRWMMVTARPIHSDESDATSLVIGLTDIQELVQERQAREESEERYRLLIENEYDVVMHLDLDTTIRWTSPSIADLAGWQPSETVGRRAYELVHPDDQENLIASIQTVLDGKPGIFEGRFTTKSGGWRWVAARAHALFDDKGDFSGAVVNVRDVEEEVLMREALAESEERFRLAMASAPIGMAVVDLDGRFEEVNPKLCEMVGYDEESLMMMRVSDLLDNDDNNLELRMRSEILSGRLVTVQREHQLTCADGTQMWIEHAIGLLRDHSGLPVSYVSTFTDVTETKAAHERLAYQATHDMLTHLVNRQDLFDRADQVMNFTKRTGTRVGALYIDVDDLKVINDTYGHAAGDRTLIRVAERLTAACRSNDIVSRIGGDEFVILLPGLHFVGDAEAVARKILVSFWDPVEIDGSAVAATLSIGVTLADPMEDAEVALRHADAALYRAKASGRARAVTYDPSLD